MVKKTEEDWESHNLCSSSSCNLRKYIDVCQNWLITPIKDTEEMSTFNNTPNGNIRNDRMSPVHFGMYKSEVRNIKIFNCTVCSTSVEGNGKCITANPFSRAEMMLVCETCHHRISGRR